MKCPNCGYEPAVNEYDYCEAPGRFYELCVEAKRAATGDWYSRDPDREQIFGCPSCGVMFMDMGYEV